MRDLVRLRPTFFWAVRGRRGMMAGMKISVDAAMRARDVSPDPDGIALAAATREDAAATPLPPGGRRGPGEFGGRAANGAGPRGTRLSAPPSGARPQAEAAAAASTRTVPSETPAPSRSRRPRKRSRSRAR